MRKTLPIFLIISILVFFIFSLIIPGFATSALKKRNELRLLQNEEKIIPQAKGLLSSKNDQITLIEGSFPTKEKLVLAVAYFDSQAVASGVLADLHFETEDVIQDQNGDTVVPVRIVIEGDYANILTFIATLQKGKYFYKLGTIEGDVPLGLRAKNKVTVKANLYASN